MTDKIIVEVSGGVVQMVSDIPQGIEVEIRDYDTDGVDENAFDARKDEKGDLYIESVFNHRSGEIYDPSADALETGVKYYFAHAKYYFAHAETCHGEHEYLHSGVFQTSDESELEKLIFERFPYDLDESGNVDEYSDSITSVSDWREIPKADYEVLARYI